VPLPTTSEAEAVELICTHVQREALKPTDRSIQAVLDFQLATKINVALLDQGYHDCDVEAEAGKVTVVIAQRGRSQGALARTMQSLRYEKLEQEVQEVASAFDEVRSIEVRPGAGYGRPSRTLLVDDEREYVMTLSERLEMRDIPADVAYDGEEALTFVNTEAPDVMVLDLRMPGMDGLEVLRRIKRDHPQVEVIIVTGHGTDTDERIARELGAFDYLKKPVDIKVLAQKIKEASNKARGEPGEETEQDDG
jgi:two-component system response regulator CpxR